MAAVAPDDIELGAVEPAEPAAAAPAKSDKDEPPAKEEFNNWYYIVYAFSMFVCLIGFLNYFFMGFLGGGGLLGTVAGTLLLSVGIYLPLQADLIVTYLRLTRETARFKQNNKRFKSGLKRQEAQIRKLKKAEAAFEKLDKQFGGNIEKALEELEELQASAKDKIQQSANALLSMYSANADRIITAGAKVDEAISMLTMLYCRIYPNFFDRMKNMKQGIVDSPRFEKDQGLTAGRMGIAFQVALSEPNVDDITAKIRGVMAEKGRATIEKEWLDDEED